MSERANGFILGLLLGIVLGATLMIFFAPAEGEKTRQQVLEQGVALRRRAEATIEGMGDQVKERSQEAFALASKPLAKQKRGWARLRFW
jgi:gas vesicle protein